MAITSISRNSVGNPNIVFIVTTNDLTEITTAGYIDGQADNIAALNSGAFEWSATDMILIYYSSEQIGWFVRDADTEAFVSVPANGGISNTLASGRIIVGNVSNVATAVAMSNDVAISNTGAATIQANAVTGAKMANNTVDYAQLALDVGQVATVTLSAAQIAGLYGTPIQLVAAPGAGKLVLIDEILWDIAFVSTQYTAGGVLAAQYGNTIHGAGPAASGTLAAATLNAIAASGYLSQAGSQGVVNVAASASLNTAVYLSNATQAFATGNSTATLYVKYRVITPA